MRAEKICYYDQYRLAKSFQGSTFAPGGAASGESGDGSRDGSRDGSGAGSLAPCVHIPLLPPGQLE